MYISIFMYFLWNGLKGTIISPKTASDAKSIYMINAGSKRAKI